MATKSEPSITWVKKLPKLNKWSPKWTKLNFNTAKNTEKYGWDNDNESNSIGMVYEIRYGGKTVYYGKQMNSYRLSNFLERKDVKKIKKYRNRLTFKFLLVKPIEATPYVESWLITEYLKKHKGNKPEFNKHR